MSDLSGKTIKGYQLQARLGEGAYGAVYRATQTQVGREVAIKIILPEYANQPDFIRRFETEAQLVAQLEHLHIVPLYDYWREPGGAYLVMRLMKGGSLEDSLRESGPWEPVEAARLVDQIASALDAAHRQGVVHRDLKPANILLDEDGNAYLSDFGIAKEVGAEAAATQTGAIVGTPAYITPEQVQSQPVTPQTDIYTLGVVLYEVLVGGHPFPDTPTGELVVKHLSEPLPYVRERRAELPAAVDGVIQRATAKDPPSRYADAHSLATDLRRALGMEVEVSKIAIEEIYNPYKGLRAFQETDADDFFGRDALIGQLIARLIPSPFEGEGKGEGGNRFLAVVGPSGSGKSSVVKAGLVPALRKGALPGSDEWFISEMVPGTHPLEELERALLRVAADPDLNLQEQLSNDSFGLLKAAWLALPSKDSELLLVIDQFEELFVLVEDEDERAHFLDLLHTAVTDKDSIVRVVVTLRADFYDRPLMYPEFGQLVETRTAIVLPLTAEELEQAVRAPAERVGAVLEQGLVPAITADVTDQPGALPLLQYALTELFERRDGRMLTNEAYQSIGGVLGALGRRAEEVYASLDVTGKDISRQLFLRLVTLGEGTEDTRRRVLRTELEGLIRDSDQGIGDRGDGVVISNQQWTISNVIDAFGQARLLTFDRDPETRAPTVEVAHEALLYEWRRLREWLDESRADIRMQRVLGNAATEWLESERDPGFLLRGSRLDQFEGWCEGTDLALTADEGAFMDASLAERRAREAAEAERQAREAAMERRSRNFLRGLVVVLAVAAVVAAVLSVFAFNQQGIAQDNAATATIAQGQAQNEAATAQAESLARATAEAETADERDRAVGAEQDALEQRDRAVVAEQEALVQASIGLAAQSSLELEGSAPERSVLLALEALENYPYTWQAEHALGQSVLNNHLRQVLSHDDLVLTAQWSADGTRILTAAEDGTARVWDALSGEELVRITEGSPYMASWSPDERSILAVNYDTEIMKVWDTETGSDRFTLQKGDYEGEFNININSWEPWSPSGDRFLTFTYEGPIKIWDAGTGEALHTLSGHQDMVNQAYWSPSGELIASSSMDDTVILWEAETGKRLYTLQGGFETEAVAVGSWSPSGDRFATRGMGGVKAYDSATGRQLLDLSVPGVHIWQVSWSSDEMLLLTTGREDGTARVWDAESGQELDRLEGFGHANASDWSPAGDLAAVGGRQNVKVWERARSLETLVLSGSGNNHIIGFSPQGESILATGGETNKVKVFDLSEAYHSIPIPDGWISGLFWSPSGEQFAAGLADGTARVWDTDSGEEYLVLAGHEGNINNIYWSPTEDRILSAVDGLGVRIWDSATGEPQLTLPAQVLGAIWSPDGKWISTHGYDGKVIVWDAATGEATLTFSEHQDWVSWSVWSPDGAQILSTGANGEAYIWDAFSGEVLLDLYNEDYNLEVTAAGWIMDGQRVVLKDADGIVRILDSGTGEELFQFATLGYGYNISFSPSEERVLIGNADGRAVVWNMDTGVEIIDYYIGAWIESAYSPDGSRVLLGNNVGSLQVFPAWQTTQELIDYAYDCCVFRELTAEERELFGLPKR